MYNQQPGTTHHRHPSHQGQDRGLRQRPTYLGDGLQAAGELDLVDAMVHRLAVGGTLGHGALAATTAHTHTVDDVTCRGQTHKEGQTVTIKTIYTQPPVMSHYEKVTH